MSARPRVFVSSVIEGFPRRRSGPTLTSSTPAILGAPKTGNFHFPIQSLRPPLPASAEKSLSRSR